MPSAKYISTHRARKGTTDVASAKRLRGTSGRANSTLEGIGLSLSCRDRRLVTTVIHRSVGWEGTVPLSEPLHPKIRCNRARDGDRAGRFFRAFTASTVIE